MAERVEYPQTLSGDEGTQLRQIWSYLYQLADGINNNLDAIGGNELTDKERLIMKEIVGKAEAEEASSNYESLKSLIIKTADFVQTTLTEYRLKLIGETVASGVFGRYVRQTGLDVSVTPEGITQNYTFQEIVQGLQEYKINAKNYIKTGLLRTVSSIPVYGVAIGKDVVTFEEDGTEVYNDGNKVAELTADELSFWQNGAKIASYTGSKITFYYGADEVFYIQGGKIYCNGDFQIETGNDMTINSGGKLIVESGATFTITSTNFTIDENGNVTLKGDVEIGDGKNLTVKSGGDMTVKSGGDFIVESGGTFQIVSKNFTIDAQGNVTIKGDMEVGDGKELTIKNGGDLKIESGGTLDVNSNNFEINSQDRTVKSGDWTFYEDGLLMKHEYTLNSNTLEANLFFGKNPTLGDVLKSAAFIYQTLQGFAMVGGRSIPKINLGVKYTDANNNLIERIVELGWGWAWGEPSTSGLPGYFRLCPTNDYTLLGGIDHKWYQGLFQTVVTDTLIYTTMTQSSSWEVKEDIRDMKDNGERIDRLRPVTFRYKHGDGGKIRQGLIYEETVGIMPEICTETGNNKGINYMELVPMLLKEIQSLRARVASLEERIDRLESREG